MSAELCPTEEKLYAIVAGEGSEAETTHVAMCNDCQVQLRKLQTEATILRHAGEQARSNATAASTTNAPATIGKFIIVGIWDENPSFITYRGLHPIVQQDVLIQVANQPRNEEAAYQEAFRAACGRWMRERPHVAPVVDAGTYESRPYFVVKFNDGVRLDRLTGEEQLDASSLVQLFGQIAQALATDEQTPHSLLRRASIVVEDDGQPMLVDWAAAEFGASKTDATGVPTNPTSRLLAIAFCEAVLQEDFAATANEELRSSAKLVAGLTSRQISPGIAEIMARAITSEGAGSPSVPEIAAALLGNRPKKLWERVFHR